MSTAEAARSSTTGPPGSNIFAGPPRRRFGRARSPAACH